MWREISLLAESKPVIASMVDVAASGGYYMAMAAQTILSENLTLTGSIGVFKSSLHFLATFFLQKFSWFFVALIKYSKTPLEI